MKILAIRGCNLASLEDEFEINFNQEPLLSAGIYAITGNTGSGKSTILDALCLALFDKTPRTQSAERIKIDDEIKDINQQDPRNVLRKGSVYGYAEVEFQALNGVNYRSRWSVRRAKNSILGAIQSSEIRLTNLNTMEDESGKKGELTLRISTLIGLNFPQFTRTVLLAQGDFSAFLKAKQNEKADLLEKLTGTEIYSEISKKIYENRKISEENISRLKEQMDSVKLMSEEELEEKRKEKKILLLDVDALQVEQKEKIEEQKWIETCNNLEEQLNKTKKELELIQKTRLQCFDREKYLVKVEQSQEIRDEFIEWKQETKKQTTLRNKLALNKEEIKQTYIQLENITSQLKLGQDNLKIFEAKYQKILPEIETARKLDILFNEQLKQSESIGEEFISVEKNLIQNKNNEEQVKKDFQEITEKFNTIKNWIDSNCKFEPLLPSIQYLSIQLKNLQTLRKNSIDNNNNLNETEKLILNLSKEIETTRKDLDHLNEIFPADVLYLRESLEVGQPCPVCGSLDHPLNINTGNNELIEREKLDRLREGTAKLLEDNISLIKKYEQERTRIKTVFEKDKQQEEEITAQLEQLLGQWNSKIYLLNNFDNNALEKIREDLENTHTTWLDYSKQKQEKQERLISIKGLLENIINNIKGEELQLVQIKEKKLKAENDLKKIKQERATLLQGKEVDKAIRSCEIRREELTKLIEENRSSRERISIKYETTKNTINEVEKEIDECEKMCLLLNRSITDWLNNKQEIVSIEELDLLIEKDATWINSERTDLKNKELEEIKVKATLDERKQNLSTHLTLQQNNINYKILRDKSHSEKILDRLSNIQLELENKNKYILQIEILLSKQEELLLQMDKFQKDFKEKNEICENWRKLDHLLGSSKGDKFRKIAQGYTLDSLLAYTNKHLIILSPRYQLQRHSNSLSLQVIDMDMGNDIRPVYSLSGGESFLISLALALGLSSLSSNQIKVETLFIDEGFGSLDSSTLGVALDALETLQSQGRKVGVISHVVEMTERVLVQIQVHKINNGKSKIIII